MTKHYSKIIILSFLLCAGGNAISQNAWTQQANFPGGARAWTVQFTIGHYGFVGCGQNGSGYHYDFWKWNQTNNTWSAIPNYPGAGAYCNLSFSIEGKGYIGLGWTGSAGAKDLWEYDTITNAWTAMATFPGSGRYSCSAFVIGHKAYIVGGSVAGPPYLKDVWVYDAHQNTWTNLNNYPGGDVESYISFAIGNHGYVGNGYWNPGCYQQMFEYDTTADTWAAATPIPVSYGVTEQPGTWVIGSKAYLCIGSECTSNGLRDGWVYDTVTKGWCNFGSMAEDKLSRGNSVAFTINNHGYFCTGNDTNRNYLGDMWEYTPSVKFAASDTTTCQGDSVHFSDSSTYFVSAWNWSFPGGSPATSNVKNPWVYYSTPGTYTAKLIATGCDFTDSATKTIHVTLNPPPVVTLSGRTSICEGTTDTLRATGGGTYHWSTGSTNDTIIVSPASAKTYTLAVTNNGCTKDTSVTVNINTLSGISISGTDSVCPGNTDILTASGGTTYLWSTSQTSSSISVTVSSTKTYSCTITNGSCSIDTSITIYAKSNIPITLSLSKDSICAGDSVVLSATGGTNYLWSNSSTRSSITVTPTSTTTYILYASNPCNRDTLSVTVHVKPKPVPTISGADTVCLGQSATLKAGGGGTYVWNTGSTSSSITVYPEKDTTYILSVSNGGCTGTASVRVIVNSVEGTLNSLPSTCAGDSIELTATGGGTYLWSTGSKSNAIYVFPTGNSFYSVTITKNGCTEKLTTEITIYTPSLYACCDTTINSGESVKIISSGATSYKWSPANGLSCTNCPDPTANPTITTTYTVIATDSAGCTVERVVTVKIEEPCTTSLQVPNVFTPNGDGINDVFAINLQSVSDYSIYIYNRWGKEMYSSTNPNAYWTGINQKDNNLVSDGVYYYILKYTCNNKSYNKEGFVQVIR